MEVTSVDANGTTAILPELFRPSAELAEAAAWALAWACELLEVVPPLRVRAPARAAESAAF